MLTAVLYLQLDLVAPGVPTEFDIPSEMTAAPGDALIRKVNPESIDFKNLMKEILVRDQSVIYLNDYHLYFLQLVE